jgi:hypothetical protein
MQQNDATISGTVSKVDLRSSWKWSQRTCLVPRNSEEDVAHAKTPSGSLRKAGQLARRFIALNQGSTESFGRNCGTACGIKNGRQSTNFLETGQRRRSENTMKTERCQTVAMHQEMRRLFAERNSGSGAAISWCCSYKGERRNSV